MININCTGSSTASLEEMIPFQGMLKELSEKNYLKLKNQIIKNGYSAPIFLWQKNILDGHARYLTLNRMKDEGISMPDKFPVVEISADDEKKAKRLILAYSSQYNKMTGDGLYQFMSETEMDFPELDQDFNFDAIEFKDFEKEYFTEEIGSIPGEDNIPEDAPTISKLGDIWHLGNHKIMCGDSLNQSEVLVLMAGEFIDVVLADPPYGVNYKRKGIEGATKGNDFGEIAGDTDTETATKSFSLFKKDNYIFWGANNYPTPLDHNKQWLVWDKEIIGDKYSDCEMAITSLRGRIEKFTHQWHGMIKASEHGQARVHRTQKPIALFEFCLTKFPNSKNILDPFLGSGPTLIACEKTNRKCFGMEIDPHYIDVIVKRYSDFTHQSDNIYLERDGEKIPYSTLVDLNPIL